MEIPKPTKTEVLDKYFIEARVQLLEVAAFLDRIDRAQGEADFRYTALVEAVKLLSEDKPKRVEEILLLLSDPSTEPIDHASGKGARGAHDHWKEQV